MDKSYPMNADYHNKLQNTQVTESSVFKMLEKYPETWMDINRFISENLYFKQIMTQNMCSQSPAVKLKILMDYLKSSNRVKEPFSYQIPFTRQQMANLAGLCVKQQ
jgi:CRP-like cAMP-binding protein